MLQWHIFVNVSLMYIFHHSVARKFKIAQIMQERAADWCALSGQIIHKSAATRRQIIVGALLHVCAIFHARQAFPWWYSATVTAQINSAVSSRERRAISPHQPKSKTNSGATNFATFAAEAAN